MKKSVALKIGESELVLETGQVAKQADAAVLVRYGETVVLTSVVMSDEIKEDIDFFPLTVEYQERTYAAGKIPGGFFKREGRPTEKEILTARLTDRPIRPLFPEGLRNEVQIISIVLSSDGKYNPDILSLIGAATALNISDIPFPEPVAAVRVAYLNGAFIVNPSYQQLEQSVLDLIVAGTKKGVVMLEGGAKDIKEELFYQGIEFGYQSLLPILELEEELRQKAGREKKSLQLYEISPEAYDDVKRIALPKIKDINLIADKEKRVQSLLLLSKELEDKFQDTYSPQDIKEALSQIQKEEVRRYILEDNSRVDGRKFDQLRPLSCEVGILPRTHGSALFTRGQTQSLAVTTLGSTSDEQMVESLEGESSKKFMLHYNFPPFSVGEIKPLRGPGRREIGHGALAEKALKSVMPLENEFPYTVRVVSDILESNGSSSMATVCSASLSLMDAGVSIKSAVAGVALGLVKAGDKEAILTDIAGLEDHYGDMDFKMAGTKDGVTAVQMDLKISGIDLGLISKILKQSREARLKILDVMNSVLDKPRPNVSSYAPRITSFKLESEKVALLIGPGGKTIRKIVKETGAKFDIDEDGVVNIAAEDESQLKDALERVKELTQDAEVGKIYNGRITKIMNFGAFCEIIPGKEGLIHISEISNKYVSKVDDFLKVGDEVKVKVIGIDDTGKIQLSMKQVSEPGLETENSHSSTEGEGNLHPKSFRKK